MKNWRIYTFALGLCLLLPVRRGAAGQDTSPVREVPSGSYVTKLIFSDRFLESVDIWNNIRIFVQSRPKYHDHAEGGYYYGKTGRQQWWLVKQEGKNWTTEKLIDDQKRPWGCFRFRWEGKEYAMLEYFDLHRSLKSTTSNRSRPPARLLIFDALTARSGTPESFGIEASITERFGVKLPEGAVWSRWYIGSAGFVKFADQSVKDESGAIEYEWLAPFPTPICGNEDCCGPNSEDTRSESGETIRRSGFSMWDNMGRPGCPSLNRFTGYGLRVPFQGQKKTFSIETGLPSNLVSSLFMDTGGTMWIGFYDAAPMQLDMNDGKFQKLKWGADSAKDASVLLGDNKGRLWVGTFTQGLYMVEISKMMGSRIPGIPDCRVNNIQTDGSHVWVATDVGSYLVSPVPSE